MTLAIPLWTWGERALDRFWAGVSHNEQSLRVVDVLETSLGVGLNLTWEVRDGISVILESGNRPP